MDLPCWPFLGRKTHRQCEQSISTLIHTKEPPVVGLPRWQSWQCILLTEIESLALLLAGASKGPNPLDERAEKSAIGMLSLTSGFAI